MDEVQVRVGKSKLVCIQMVAKTLLIPGIRFKNRQSDAVVTREEFDKKEVRLLQSFLKLGEERLTDAELSGH